LMEKVDTTIRGNRRFTISELSLEFPQVSRSVIYDIVSEKLGYKNLCARWVPKMLTDEHKQKRLAAAHQFLTTRPTAPISRQATTTYSCI